MARRLFFFLLSLVSSLSYSSTLTVYVYDSFVGKATLGEALKERFEKEFHASLQWVPFSSAGEALNQLVLEKKTPRADLLLGVDNSLLFQAKATGLFEPWGGKREQGHYEKACFLDPDSQFIPFDYGYLAFIYDELRKEVLPKTLKEFSMHQRFRKKIAMEDPRTSSLGAAFLVWTHSLFPEGDAHHSFWKDFHSQVLTYSPGWSGAYGLFLKGEAPFVLSYTTSPAYHVERENKKNIQAVIFPEGHYRQVEFAGLLKSSPQKDLARKFLDLLLSQEIQEKVPTTQWMYPVSTRAVLPKSFQTLKIPKTVSVDWSRVEKEKKKWLGEWSLTVIKAQ